MRYVERDALEEHTRILETMKNTFSIIINLIDRLLQQLQKCNLRLSNEIFVRIL